MKKISSFFIAMVLVVIPFAAFADIYPPAEPVPPPIGPDPSPEVYNAVTKNLPVVVSSTRTLGDVQLYDVQMCLFEKGYFNSSSRTVSGYYDYDTENAVENFQKSRGFEELIPGYEGHTWIGPRTRQAMNAECAGLTKARLDGSKDIVATIRPGKGVGTDWPNDQVSEMNDCLIKKGYLAQSSGGYYDDASQAAMKKFQSANGLSADGVVGQGTRTALNRVCKMEGVENVTNSPLSDASYVFTKTLRFGMEGDSEIGKLQQCLINHGYLEGVPNNAIYGPTSEAIKKFQRANGLGGDGVVGRNTRAALNRICGTPSGTTPATPGSQSGIPAGLQSLIDAKWPQPCNGSGSTECGVRNIGYASLGGNMYYIWAFLPTFDDSTTGHYESAIAIENSGTYTVSHTFESLRRCRNHNYLPDDGNPCP